MPDQLHRAPGRLQHRGLDVDRRVGLLEQSPSLLRVRPVEPDDDRVADLHPVERREDPARHLVAARDPAEDVEQDGFDLRVGGDDLERVDHALGVPPAPEVAEVRRAAAGKRDHVQRGHDQPGAVPEDADLAVELHVGDALLAGEALLGRVGVEVEHVGDVRRAGRARCRRP